MDSKTVLFALYLCSGALLALLALPLIRGKVPPNPWYGFRVRQTLADPAVWYPANRYSGRWMFATGLAWMVAAAVGYFVPVGLVPYAFGCVAVVVAVLALGLVQSFRHLRTLRNATGR